MPEEWVMVGKNQFAMMNVVAKHMRAEGTSEDDQLLILSVWYIAISYIKNATGEVMASYELLADAAGTTPEKAEKAMEFLESIGAFVRAESGRYAINQTFGFGDQTPRH